MTSQWDLRESVMRLHIQDSSPWGAEGAASHAALPGETMSVSASETLVRRAIDAIWNRGDLAAADELFAADYVNHHGMIADLVLGPEAIKIVAALYRVAFPHLHVSVDEVDTIGDIVV